uniref:R3H domain containing-like n=1 Tax=Sinocyclocheilus anshuiensis TaxID=1608454 RepID=A0A671K840_9TELE
MNLACAQLLFAATLWTLPCTIAAETASSAAEVLHLMSEVSLEAVLRNSSAAETICLPILTLLCEVYRPLQQPIRLGVLLEDVQTCVFGSMWKQATLLVCNYSIKGSWVGEAPYKTGKSCSACPSSYGGSCNKNQCDSRSKSKRNASSFRG